MAKQDMSQLFASPGEVLHVLLGHCRKVGRISNYLVASHHIRWPQRESLILLTQIRKNESLDPAGLLVHVEPLN